MTPSITVLITVYNEEAWIAQAVRSVLSQTQGDIEVLVIDDGSDDRTPKILGGFNDARLRVLRRERIGRAAALAFGVREAHGPLIAILDADDEAFPDRLAKQAAYLALHPDVAWLGCGEERRDRQRGEEAVRFYPRDDGDIRRMAVRCIPYSHSGVMFRRALVDEGLNYDTSVPYLIDFEFFLRVAERHRVANLPEPLVMRRVRDESFFQTRFRRRAQNRALARLSASAVRRFRLPLWHLVFPFARLGYDFVPNAIKRRVRRIAGLKEKFAEQP